MCSPRVGLRSQAIRESFMLQESETSEERKATFPPASALLSHTGGRQLQALTFLKGRVLSGRTGCWGGVGWEVSGTFTACPAPGQRVWRPQESPKSSLRGSSCSPRPPREKRVKPPLGSPQEGVGALSWGLGRGWEYRFQKFTRKYMVSEPPP